MNAVLTILIGSIFVNNFAMSRFYGICPFLGVSKKLETAFGMGMAVTFVMAVASLVAYLVNTFLLIPLEHRVSADHRLHPGYRCAGADR